MVNTLSKARLEQMLEAYRRDFTPQHWDAEKYKWKALKHFQDHWDLNARDFPEMLKFSLSRTGNLLAGMKRYPARMIVHFAKADPEAVRNMFANLFRPERDIYGRIDEFKTQSALLLEKHADQGKQHYQNENAVSTYLWLRYPEMYYIYKFHEGKMVAAALESNLQFVIADYANNVRNFYELYDELRQAAARDSELLSLYHGYLSDEFYSDPELCVLAADVGHYIAGRMEEEQKHRKAAARGAAIRKEAPADEGANSQEPPSAEKETRRNKAKPVERQGFWWLHVNPKIRSLSTWPVGAVQAYPLYSGSRQHGSPPFPDAKPGDLMIGYESAPVKQVVALAKVCAEPDGDTVSFEKLESLSTPIDDSALMECPELAGLEFFRSARGSLSPLTAEEYGLILDIIRQENPIQPSEAPEPYSEEDFLGEVYMRHECYGNLAELLRDKKNIILQGAPGVGKTFAARRLAWAMMGEKDKRRIQFIQFHQNYSYEDFVMGYKPTEKGFALKYGVFYQFCQMAASHPGLDYFFIIDEINRGNMSKIFGELLMLIEGDYRGTKMIMSYNGLPFSFPKNLYIIGMMNTADRSLAMIDYALRRRFGFFEMQPAFDSDGFVRYQRALGSNQFDQLIAQVKELNQEILRDRSLGRGFAIGHSYFCGRRECTDQWLRLIVDHDILPTLSEYWFDDPEKVARWERVLHGALA